MSPLPFEERDAETRLEMPGETHPWDHRRPPSKRPRLARNRGLHGACFSLSLSTSFSFRLLFLRLSQTLSQALSQTLKIFLSLSSPLFLDKDFVEILKSI